MRIERLGPGDESRVLEAASLFDNPPRADATADFLARPDHYLFLAYDDGGAPAGFVSGVLMAHPDKGREMFLYELGVAEEQRRHGYGRALVERLAAAAREAGCYGMWVLADADNASAIATYESAGGTPAPRSRMLSWTWGEGAPL
ncbi:MAG: GNAT family N-acetyltransferase [Dehalococcoidia bacterium]